ncbi:PREDICTED: serine/threonine-protein kinase Nek8 [Drosophila arizonae]|uniref:non-specific serine/threonine protein kinase n=1 Tax=Drosophila arizonae TaxID=7263 RepID=A0ABM1PZ99_DROAR|nr:PREDICTED: serine/threonine-protein kinase Nek8 [Drosophila arizonae]
MDLGDANIRALRVLGEGSFGRVFLCVERNGPKERKVCVKRIIMRNPKNELRLIKEEIYIISQLRHPHIVQFIRSFMHSGTVNIVMEYAPNGTIRDVIHTVNQSNGRLGERRLLHYLSDMILGLEYLHIRHVIHRDIKPENMLLDANDRVKYADFGISNVHVPASQQPWQVIGTPLYMAPEIMCGAKCDFKSDIWSLGLVLYELCLGRNPFQSLLRPTDPFKQVRCVVKVMAQPRLDCQVIRRRYKPIWARLCELMVVYKPEQRICLPDLICIDPCITQMIYSRYFNYDY